MKIETLFFGLPGKLKERWLVLVLQPKPIDNGGLGDGDAFVSTVRSQGWNDSASRIRQRYLKQTEKGSWARRYLAWHVFRQKLLWPLGYLCLCKAGHGRAGGGRLLPAPGSSVGRAYSAYFSKLKNFLRQCRVALTSYWHWHNSISGHHSIYAVWSETNLSSSDISIALPQPEELRFLNQPSSSFPLKIQCF